MGAKAIHTEKNDQEIWICPSGSYGDILMLSGVLKQSMEQDPKQKYCLVRRAMYSDLLNGHPAFRKVGYPPRHATVVTTEYWLKEKPGAGNKRPYQILARQFGLPTPTKEILYLPGSLDEDKLLQDFIPAEGRKIIVIAPSSVNPRKMAKPSLWQTVVEGLKHKGIMVVQAGQKDDIHIKGAYSLLGLTTPRQLVSLLAKSDVVISVDNFVMHAAHLIGKPAIIIWGPTRSKVHGYTDQISIQCPTRHCEFRDQCPGTESAQVSPCPLKGNHCMNMFSPERIIKKAIDICFSS